MGFLDWLLGPPSKDKFARTMMKAIREAGEDAPLRYDPGQFRLLGEGEGKNEMNLANAYKEFCAAPKDRREAVVRTFVRTWFSYRRDTPEEFEDVRPDLLPGVHSRLFYELTTLEMRQEKDAEFDWPYRVLAGSLGVGLVYDLRESMMQVQRHSLDEWKVTFDQAFEVAHQNLRAITQERLGQAGPGAWVSPWRDNYDPSRMLLTDYIRGHEVAGDPVVMVPNRDTLLLAGSGDAEALGWLAATGEEAYEHPRPVSRMAFRLGPDDQWSPFLPGEGHPHYAKFKLLQVKSVGDDYGDQAATLNKIHEATGEDIFIARFSALQKKGTGEIRSYCVWSEGVVAYLPRTDDIYFFRPKGDGDGEIVVTAPWERAQAVLGEERLKPVGLHPERFRVEGFPSEEQLAALAGEGKPD